MMSIKLCWQVLHISSTTLHPEWNLSVTAARRPCFTPRCNVLHPRPGRTHEGALAPAEERLMERWRQEVRFYRLFFPAATLGLMSPCYASACSLPRAVTLLSLFLFLSCPTAMLPSFSINPFRPKEVPLSLLFILSQTPGVISSSFPTSCFFTLDTFYQCFSHLWPCFLPAISYFAAGKDTRWANFSSSRVETHNSK